MRRWTLLFLGVVLAVAPTAQAQAHAHTDRPTPRGATPVVTEPSYGKGWRRLAPIARGPRQEHSVAAVGHRVYVIGGLVRNPAGLFSDTDRVEVYDTRRDTWSDAAPLPVAMTRPNAATVDGKIYVLGGLSSGVGWRALDDSFVYDPRADLWTPLPPVPADIKRGRAAMGVHGTKIYLAGGIRPVSGSGGPPYTVDSVSSYDVVTGQWEALPSLPQPRDSVGAAVIGTTLYVLGGWDRGRVNVWDTVYVFDLRSRRWSARAPMPTPRADIATAAVGTMIYTFGGERSGGAGPVVFAETEAYDTVHDRWRRLAPMPVPRQGTAAVAVGCTIHLPGGGGAGVDSPVDVNDAYRHKQMRCPHCGRA